MGIPLAIVLVVLATLLLINLTSGGKDVRIEPPHLYPISDPQFARSISALLGPPILPGNEVTALYNGDQIFPAMLSALHSAAKTITFETYIYWSGDVGRQFAAALVERARAGVRVHVLIDAVGGAKMDRDLLEEMASGGVEIERFRPIRWYSLGKLNNRTHRKLLVVDGRIGFTGGVGIADLWRGNADRPDHWRDSHFRIAGPAVGQMQAAFVDHWIDARGVVLDGEAYFPPLAPVGSCQAQAIRSGTNDAEGVHLLYLLSLTAAAETIRIANAYFVPDDVTVQAIVAARRRGVEVTIIVPGRHVDSVVVRRASKSRWGPLLEAGVRIYEYTPTMYHCKVMVVDDCWTVVGSTNFDDRSFRLNDEANLSVLDRDFARAETRQFEVDRARAREVTFEAWRKRPWRERALESIAALARRQL